MSIQNQKDFYNENTFIVPVTNQDLQVRLRNVLGVIVHTLSPLEVKVTFVEGFNIRIKTLTDIHLLMFTDNDEALRALLLLQLALEKVKDNITDDPSGGVLGKLGVPTDGAYGFKYPSIANVAKNDRVEDAFDKITTFLERFVPIPPPDLNNIILSSPSGYTARKESSTTIHNDILTNDIIILTSTEFLNPKTGNLTATINGNNNSVITLFDGDNRTTNNNLEIISDEDAYLNDTKNEGYWKQLITEIETSSPNNLTLGENIISLDHLDLGFSSKTVYLDDPKVPSIDNNTISISSNSIGKFISGVPVLGINDLINIKYDIEDSISEYYNLNRVISFSNSAIGNNNIQPLNPSKGDIINVNSTKSIINNVYSLGASFILRGHSSDNSYTTETSNTNFNIDSISNEVRVQSGSGKYPSIYGGIFNSSLSILNNEELQLIGGVYKFPLKINYNSYYPSGPDYTSIQGGSHNDYRWVTFNSININQEVGLTITFNNALNFNNIILNDTEIYIRVEGINGTNGWLNVNEAYSGVGIPDPNNDNACLVYSNSTSTKKVITFSTVRSGNVIVRIGLKEGSNKSFSSISIT